jgi:hypothetical protein
MLANLTLRTAFALAPVILVILVFGPNSIRVATAQTITRNVSGMVEVPERRLKAIQNELSYLRSRDAERQAWERSIMNRLPSTGVVLAGGSNACDKAGEPTAPGVKAHQKSHWAGKSRGCLCGCYPCQCPLPEAPCLDCPRVSTLTPYSNVHIFGALKLDMLFSNARSVSPGTPFFLFPGATPGFDESSVSIHARQSTMAAAFTGPQFHGLQSGGLVVTMFFNDSVVADQYGFLPLQAWGELKNENWRFAAGLQFDVFSPGIPTVLPFSALAASGNSGNSFRGQVRLERFLHPSDDKQWTLQLALSEPISSTIDPMFRALEDNGWPNVEGRVALGLGPTEGAGLAAKRPFEFGISGVVGQIRTTVPLVRQVVVDVWGASVDFRWKVNDFFGVMGELYTGQALGTYSGGVLQNINTITREGIRSSGGFGEVFLYWTPCLHSHIGYGIDNPVDRDIAVGGRLRNSTIFANVLWDLNPTFRIGLEFTWRETEYKALRDNEGAGFHTQFQWAF